MFDKIEVTPDPSSLNIPEGKIKAFTVIKRKEIDNIMYAQTPNIIPLTDNDGFLIPEDLTKIQKDNVQVIIDELNRKNALKK